MSIAAQATHPVFRSTSSASAPISRSWRRSSRQAAGLSRQRRHVAEAARGDRRDFRLLRGQQRQYSSRRALSFRTRHRRIRSGARDRAEIHQRREPDTKSSSCAAPPKASISSRKPTAARTIQCGRRSAHHRHGAPFEYRALADSLRRKGREAARRSDQRPGRAAARRIREAARPENEARLRHARFERPWHDQPAPRIVDLAHAMTFPCWSMARRPCRI